MTAHYALRVASRWTKQVGEQARTGEVGMSLRATAPSKQLLVDEQVGPGNGKVLRVSPRTWQPLETTGSPTAAHDGRPERGIRSGAFTHRGTSPDSVLSLLKREEPEYLEGHATEIFSADSRVPPPPYAAQIPRRANLRRRPLRTELSM